MSIRVHVDAERTDRSLNQAAAPKKLRKDPRLLFWRRLLESAVADAKKTKNGLPTDLAILAKWWIVDYRPSQDNRDDWRRSFECACHWLDLDPEAERKKRVEEIEASLLKAYQDHVNKIIYQHRAAILTCAGEPTAIARQYVLPLVDEKDYEMVAGIDNDDLFALYT